MNDILRVGITHGDINGIGYEVMLKMLEDERLLELCTPIVYGSAKVWNHYRKLLGLPSYPVNVIASAEEARDGEVNIVDLFGDQLHPEPGVGTPEAGHAAFVALEAAVADAKEGVIDAIVTAPINKHTAQSAEFDFPGHTEYLEDRTGAHGLMVLFNSRMRVALVSTHLPVSRIAEAVTPEAVTEKLQMLNASLVSDFGLSTPRIAVLALNPHAGDGGLLGEEELNVITPAIEQAQAARIQAFGPYPADGFFGAGMFAKFDGVLAMYHDQGLAPFKTLAMDSGVNFTAGLPIVRTSPDHGTGYDIAGQGIASEASMREALYAAIDIARCRARHAEATANPLTVRAPRGKGND